MNQGSLKGVLQENWHLAILVVGLVAVGSYLQLRSASAASAVPDALDPETMAASSHVEPSLERPSPQKEARDVISRHKAQFEADPAGKDAPALLNAMGNLYRYKLGDYANAIQAYQLVLHDYPEYEGIRNTLISLAVCYEHEGNREGVRDVYKQMLKRFPPESQEFQYAKAQLGR